MNVGILICRRGKSVHIKVTVSDKICIEKDIYYNLRSVTIL